MKNAVILTLCLLSTSVFASFNELECETTSAGKEISLEVEQPFPTSSVFKQALLTVTENGTQKDFNYTLTARRNNGFNQIQYTGAGLRVEVDLWPDQSPRWGRTYRSTISSSDLGNTTLSNVDCRFPNAF